MTDQAAYTFTQSRRMDGTDAVVDVGAALRASGFGPIADSVTAVVGIGVVYRTWAATVDGWTDLVAPTGELDDALVDVSATVLAQALRRRRLGCVAGVTRIADQLAVPADLVAHLLAQADGAGRRATTGCGWPTLAGLDAVTRDVESALPPGALRMQAAEVALVRLVDPDRACHEVVTGPSPSGCVRARVPEPVRLATTLLASTVEDRTDEVHRARLAMRLASLATWQATAT